MRKLNKPKAIQFVCVRKDERFGYFVVPPEIFRSSYVCKVAGWKVGGGRGVPLVESVWVCLLQALKSRHLRHKASFPSPMTFRQNKLEYFTVACNLILF